MPGPHPPCVLFVCFPGPIISIMRRKHPNPDGIVLADGPQTYLVCKGGVRRRISGGG